jgi:hypothetical protein
MNRALSVPCASTGCLRRKAWLAVCALFFILWAAIGWDRFANGLRYLPLHARITNKTVSPPPDGIHVETTSPFGTTGTLESHPDDPGLFLAPWASPTTLVTVHLPAGLDLAAIGSFALRAHQLPRFCGRTPRRSPPHFPQTGSLDRPNLSRGHVRHRQFCLPQVSGVSTVAETSLC